MSYFLLFLLYIILSFKKCYNKSKRYITIPFSFQREKEYSSQSYNSKIFLQNNFYRNIIFNFNIGNPPQKVDGIILNDNKCFEMKSVEDSEIYKTYNKYNPKDSNSFTFSHKELRWDKGQYMTLGYDVFEFEDNKKNNLTFLFKKSGYENIDSNEIKNKKYIIKFGLEVQTSFSGDECPNFLYYLKAKFSLSKYLIAFIFKNDNEGHILLGEDLYKYNSKKYNESDYTGVYSFNYNSLNHNQEIIFDEKNNKNITINKSDAFIKYESGIIIGTNEYRKAINELFFDKLISNKECKIDIVKLNETNEYYIYSCKENTELKNFPKLIFFSRNYRYNFELNYQDLFIKKFDNNIYFLILFKVEKNFDNFDNDVWILGEPFYKKYTFSFNLDAKIIGFYKKIMDDENNNTSNTDNNNNIVYKIFLIIFLSIIGLILIIILMVISFYYGMNLKDKRKKRANELKEDDYEYLPENNKDQNKIIN